MNRNNQSKKASIIDHIISDINSHITYSLDDSKMSDHKLINMSFNIASQQCENRKQKCTISKTDYYQMKLALDRKFTHYDEFSSFEVLITTIMQEKFTTVKKGKLTGLLKKLDN